MFREFGHCVMSVIIPLVQNRPGEIKESKQHQQSCFQSILSLHLALKLFSSPELKAFHIFIFSSRTNRLNLTKLGTKRRRFKFVQVKGLQQCTLKKIFKVHWIWDQVNALWKKKYFFQSVLIWGILTHFEKKQKIKFKIARLALFYLFINFKYY